MAEIFAERITANKTPRILDVEGFSFLIGGGYGDLRVYLSLWTRGLVK